MKTVVVYESIYGNTAAIAHAIAEGIASAGGEVVVLPADPAVAAELDDADLLVVGGPTHVHGMSSETSRRAALDTAAKESAAVHPEGESVRGLLEHLGEGDGMRAAAFDTRAHGPRVLTGSASRAIARRLRRHGFELVDEAESFVVSGNAGPLADWERERATAWGTRLAAVVAPATTP
jgi:hypothetical protein